MKIIQPTIGRMLHFYPAATDTFLTVGPDRQPLPVTICYVHSNIDINVAGFDANGDPFSRQNVYLYQEETPAPADGDAYATWMPYQMQKAIEEGTLIDVTAPTSPEPAEEIAPPPLEEPQPVNQQEPAPATDAPAEVSTDNQAAE